MPDVNGVPDVTGVTGVPATAETMRDMTATDAGAPGAAQTAAGDTSGTAGLREAGPAETRFAETGFAGTGLGEMGLGEGSASKFWLPPMGTRVGATFYVRRSQPWLKHYFGVDMLDPTWAAGLGGMVSWGGRAPAKFARAVSRIRRVPHFYLEDGFLRSVGLGKENALPISIQIDDLGMPVRADRPSRLERLIADAAGSQVIASLGGDIREALVRHRLSKYNSLPHRAPKIDRTVRRRILLVDQVYGDVSVPMAGGSPESFRHMLADAVQSGAQCVVRTHPDVMAGFRKGYMTEEAAKLPGVILSSEPVSAASLIEVVDEVWTMSSQFGLDALLRGVPVRCYAAPFYAGWGLTEDRFETAAPGGGRPGDARSGVSIRRQARPGIDHLAAAAFSLYPVYRDQTTWGEIDVFAAVERLIAERRTLGLDG